MDWVVVLLSGIFAVLLVLKIIFSTKKMKILKFYFTPMVTISVICLPLYFLYSTGGSQYAVLVAAALTFSLAGDIINMREERDNSHLYFSGFFFLFTHLLYIAAFLPGYRFGWWQILVVVPVVVLLIRSYFLFKDQFSSILLKIFIPLYSMVVSVSLIVAVGAMGKTIGAREILAATGIVFLWASDFFLGVHSFWHKIKYDSVIIWGLYAPGQFLIALSCFMP
ncbi:MAG: lysoplasmalogenase [Spirochaetales bacterium]|nr:lysoplasmalogenase [Spirochaetales bacterium]